MKNLPFSRFPGFSFTSSSDRRKGIRRWLLFGPPLLFLLLFYFYPLSKIVLQSFLQQGNFTFARLDSLFSSPIYLKILWFTTWQAGLSTILTLLVALPGAYIFSHYDFLGKNLLKSMMTIPFVLPTVLVAAAFRALLGSNGLLNTVLMGWFDLGEPPIQMDQSVSFFLL